MRILKIFLLAIALLFSLPAFGATVYIAQNAGTFSGGTACNGQTAVTPALVTWTAGNTYYICGTITGTSGSPIITVGASGSSGSPITILFDTGAVLQENFCGIYSAGGCLNLNSKTFIVVNGQNTGLIQSTLNGSPGGSCPGGACTTQNGPVGISNVASNDTIENLTIANMYVHTNGGTDNYPSNSPNGISLLNNNASNLTITGNTIHDVYSGVDFEFSVNGGSNAIISNNTISNICWGMDVVANGNGNTYTGIYIFGNKVFNHSVANGTGSCHANAIHSFQGNTCTTCDISGFYVYNNEFDGPVSSTDTTSQLYTDQNNSNTTIANGYYFNNIFSYANGDCAATCDALFAHSDGSPSFIYNNTFIGNATATSQQNSCMQAYVLTGVVFENNYASDCQIDNQSKGSSWGTLVTNYYANGGFGFGSSSDASCCVTFASWKTSTGGDSTSVSSASTTVLPKCNSSTDCSNVAPAPSSAVVGFATNLNSICSGQPNPGLGALCFDKVGKARPVSAAWDAGALCSTTTCSGGGGGTVATPTFSPVAGGYTSAQTVTLATTTPSATICYRTDGGIPAESGNVCTAPALTYSTPIAVKSSETLTALGTLSGFTDSAVATGNYSIGTAPSPAMFASVAVQ